MGLALVLAPPSLLISVPGRETREKRERGKDSKYTISPLILVRVDTNNTIVERGKDSA